MRKTRSVRHGYRVSPIRGARFRRVTAGLTAWCFFMHVTLLPVVAQRVVVDPDAAASHQATLDTAPNGVPIQNIAAPNASGLSHNKFQEFNVGTEGLVINNRQAHGQSTLAGYILGNPNLQGGSEARLILNEVTGSTRSSLEGHTEIFGHPAEYILANPYGITCNGCGFLNIPRATFTTGAPTLDAATGLLTGFSVNGGDVMIGEHGVNGLELDYFDIVSRAIHVNGVIHGQDVGLFAGRNDFDYAARTVTARAADGSSKPRFGIDSSLLGGMYANRITLVGTEAGVGVRAPARMSAGTAGMVLTANGNLMVRHATSEGRITAHAQRNSLAIDGNVRADTALELMARDEIRLSQTAAAVAGGDLTASSKRLILGRDAILAAGLDHDGNLLASGTVNVTATDELTSSREALLVGGHRIKVTAGAVSNSGTISAGGQTTVTAATSVTNRGAITAQDDLAVTAGATLTNEAAATISSGHTLTLAVHDLVNRGTLAAQTGLDTTTTGAMENAGTVHSGKAATFTIAETFHNRNGATVLTKENLTLSASTIENAGEMIVEGNAAVTARTGAVSNSGKLSAGGRTTVT
ncbi:MAG: filamentous hemagglutinin N-terminal domain-containing protein, partial [Pseudomonadales bacterium]|nr:filamentous hemagglutinin N-terminal domain-containing protein [Pseudomonadales bacterium]